MRALIKTRMALSLVTVSKGRLEKLEDHDSSLGPSSTKHSRKPVIFSFSAQYQVHLS